MNTIEYAHPHSLSDARSMQRLTLQDLELGGFPRPDTLAHPNNPKLVLRQLSRVRKTPDNYLGASVDGKLIGYLKTAEWRLADEYPFATEIEQQRLEELRAHGVSIDPRLRLGIFGLVVSDTLPKPDQAEIADHFFDVATDRALAMGDTAVNIVLHQNDPVRSVAIDHGFDFTGRIGEATGAPGVHQRLYSKLLDI